MESRHSSVPFLRLLFPVFIGILTGSFFKFPSGHDLTEIILIIFFTFCVLFFALQYFTSNTRQFSRYFIFSCDIFLFFFVLNSTWRIQKERSNISDMCYQNVEIVALVTDKPVNKNTFLKINLSLLENNSGSKFCKGTKIIAWLPLDSIALGFIPGDIIEISGKLSAIRASGNPNSFNYQDYMALSHVYLQLKAIKGLTKKLGHDNRNVKIKALQWREKLLQIFVNHGIDNQELAVLSALTVGYKDEIDASLKQAYTAAGVMHLMAVSGMHVGLIFLIANLLLKSLDRSKTLKIIKTLIILSLIWFYVLLTGMSASVLRAGLMLSIVLFGEIFVKKSNIYNTLSAAAFVLLVVDPLLIFNAGFQLSFLAVLSIVAFYQPIYQIVNTDNYFLDKLWSLATVSISAQILTLPLSLYLFGQFPNYFILSNIVVVPIGTLLIYGSIVLFLVSPISVLAKLLSLILIYLTRGMNCFILFVEKLPGSVMENIRFDVFQTIALYVCIISISVYILHRSYKSIVLAIAGFCCVLLIRDVEKYFSDRKTELAIWQVPSKSFYQVVNNGSAFIFSDVDEARAARLVSKWAAFSFCNNIKIGNLDQIGSDTAIFTKNILLSDNLLISKKNTVLFLTDLRFEFFTTNQTFHVDKLVVGKNGSRRPEIVLMQIVPKLIILDASVSIKMAMKWKKAASLMGIKIYDVSESGYIKTPL